MKKTKFIFITGGVYSSLGKGISSSSIGRLLTQLGFSVTMQKLDPYLNVDPTFISPLQHGELYITDDGTKADLDLGNYERFIDRDLNKYSTVTSGLIYQEIINNERNDKYDGKTVQIIPHFTNQIITKIKMLQQTNKTDFAIIEIGGTVGDIESLPFIHAICDFAQQYGQENVMFVHCVPLISIASVVGELKTKPAQHSVKQLRSLGITPNLLFLRSSKVIDEETRYKLSWSCSIKESNIFECMDLKSTYFLPEELYKQKLHKVILNYFKLKIKKDNMDKWLAFLETIKNVKKHSLKVAIVGEYVDLQDAYFSSKAAIDLTSYELNAKIEYLWLKPTELNKQNYKSIFKNVTNVLITPAKNQKFRESNMELIKWLGDQKIPTLVYGNAFEDMILTYITTNNDLVYGSNENNIFIKQPKFVSGGYDTIVDDSILNKYLTTNVYHLRHQHEYEFNSKYINLLKDINCIGYRNKNLDIIKLKKHPFFYGTYSNPEFNARPMKTDPLYLAWLKQGMK